jgi:putative NADH-flavin reductase
MAGHDIVITIVGGWPKPGEEHVSIYSDPAKAYIPAMKANGISRIFTVFGAGFLGPQIPTDWKDTGNVEMDNINKLRRDMRRAWDLV